MTTLEETAEIAGHTGDDARRDALVERVFEAFTAGAELLAMRIGVELGLYEALGTGPATAGELAGRTGIHPRYAREWLEQQAVSGVLDVAREADAHERVFELPRGHAEALLDPDSPAAAAGFPTGLMGLALNNDAVLDAYRTGGGVAFEAQGAAIRDGIGTMNRPMFVNELADWIAALPDVDRRLRAEPAARVLDVGCGTGWSAIALARAYPRITVEAIDLDPASVEVAVRNVTEAGVADRVTVRHGDGGAVEAGGGYDLVTLFEVLHDMAHPIEALRRLRPLLAPEAPVLIADERVAESFTAPGDAVERVLYAWSVLHCLPATRAEHPSVDAGTILRPDTLRAYATEAGYAGVEILPIENLFWRFYRLRA